MNDFWLWTLRSICLHKIANSGLTRRDVKKDETGHQQFAVAAADLEDFLSSTLRGKYSKVQVNGFRRNRPWHSRRDVSRTRFPQVALDRTKAKFLPITCPIRSISLRWTMPIAQAPNPYAVTMTHSSTTTGKRKAKNTTAIGNASKKGGIEMRNPVHPIERVGRKTRNRKMHASE